MKAFFSIVVAVLLCGLVMVPSLPAAPRPAGATTIYRKALRATVLVMTKDSLGTAWLVDRQSRLFITNHHVVGSNKRVEIVFPRFSKGRVVAERSAYRKVRTLRARVLRADVKRDLALLRLETALPSGVAPLKLASREPSPGASLHSVGNPGVSGALWVYTQGTVRSVYHRTWRSRGGKGKVSQHSSRVVEMQSSVNPGDSGGPVMNGLGEVVGVVQSRPAGGQPDADRHRRFRGARVLAQAIAALTFSFLRCAQKNLQAGVRIDPATVWEGAANSVVMRNRETCSC